MEGMLNTPFEEWMGRNAPRDTMLWRQAAYAEFGEMMSLAEQLQQEGFEAPLVATTHTSKSISLPVLKLVKPGVGTILLRDNFSSVNICFLMENVPFLAPEDLFEGPMTWEWYLSVIERKRDYSYKGWSDAEMADPRILRVWVKNERSTTGYWSENRGEEKDRWAKRLTDTEWYTHDWSSGKLFAIGEMGPDCTFYIASHPFCEGISNVVDYSATRCWSPGARSFTVDTDWKRALACVRTVFAAAT